MTHRQHKISFVIDGETVSLDDVGATDTLLDYLREARGLTGTKEGCAEGDCGACTVVVGELRGDAIDWRAVNSCIRFVPTLDGKEIVTSQGLCDKGDALHPAQQAMVDCHGSQCGFCTPGFVMSLFAHYLDGADTGTTREALQVALSGNLCRCTGYRPIIDAGLAMKDYAAPKCWSRADALSPARVERLRALRREAGLDLPGYQAPLTLVGFAAAYEARPDALILAGGTDVGLWVTKQMRDLPSLLYIGEVAELQEVREDNGQLVIGAAVNLEIAFAALVARYPELDELARRFASRPIRNSGTLCGNVANGSPIGDAMPALIALGASVRLRKGSAVRELALEDFYLGYQKKDLQPGEFVEAVCVPLASQHSHFALYKISKRIDQDISAVCAGIAVTLDAGVVVAARIAYGGMAATPKRASRAEQALKGQAWSEAATEAAIAALGDDFQPLSDMRASRRYRMAVAGNLLRRFWLESTGSVTRLEAVSAVNLHAEGAT